MRRHRGHILLLIFALVLAGCAAVPSARVHYTVKQDPAAFSLRQIVLLPVDVDVYEMSAGGVKEEVPEWSSAAEVNLRNALLASADSANQCCVTRQIDTATLTSEEREILEEHLALFKTVAANALWTGLPANTAWQFKREQFDATLGEGLGFLTAKYGMDAGLLILGEDVVTTAGRKTTAFVGAMFGVAIPLGHSVLIAGLVDFSSGDVLWMNHVLSTGTADLRDPDSCRELTRSLVQDYPGLRRVNDDNAQDNN